MSRRFVLLSVVLCASGCSSTSTNTGGSGGAAGVSAGGAGGAAAGAGGVPSGGSPSGGGPSGGAPPGGGGGGASGGSAGSGGSGLCDKPNCVTRADCCAALYSAGAAEYRELVKSACLGSWCLTCSQGGAPCSYICGGETSASLYDCLDCAATSCKTSLQALDTTCAASTSCKQYRSCLLPCP